MDYKTFYDNCKLCPRNCGVRRSDGIRGYCRADDELLVARAALHMWEEPCISGENGSGTVFFSGCSLGCVYCQNHNIAKGLSGKIISAKRLSEIFLELQEKNAHNINLVTPTHYVPHVAEAVELSKLNGLNIPVVYNTSGYEKISTLKMLDGIVDIYLPDFKYLDKNIAKRYSNCEDYATYAKKALKEMVRQTNEPEFNEEGIMTRGVIVRHMMLPGCLEDSKNIVKYLYETYKNHIYMSIMNQYTPLPHVSEFPEINKKIDETDYEELIDFAVELGVENGFVQDGETQSESFIPEFDGEGV